MSGHLIRRLHQVSVSVFSQKMAEVGQELTPVQYGAMCAVRAFPGLDQATVASMIAYDRVTIGGVLDRLEQKGLLTRNVKKEDKRSKVLFLTNAGQTLLRKLDPLVKVLQLTVLDGLSEEEKLQFNAMIVKVLVKSGDELSEKYLEGNQQGKIAWEMTIWWLVWSSISSLQKMWVFIFGGEPDGAKRKGLRLIISDADAAAPNVQLVPLLKEAFVHFETPLNGPHDKIEAISKASQLGKGYITSRILLTLLSPNLIKKFLNGDMTITLGQPRLLEASKHLPVKWTEQDRFIEALVHLSLLRKFRNGS